MKTLIIANWKCNLLTAKSAEELFKLLNKGLRKIRKAEIVVCPSFIYLPKLSELLLRRKKTRIRLGAQNCFWEGKGSYTGEVSPIMLKNLGCKYIIVGHSERRKFLNETNQMINRKVQAILSFGLIPILCIGETKEDKEKGKISIVLRSQIENALKKVSKKEIGKIVFAYEPRWAIGTGKACSSDEACVARLLIQKIIAQKYSQPTAKKIQILYGGSVNSANVASFVKDAGFQGVLVGSASLDPNEFAKIVKEL
ncbi:triose-phosphate isomerase [Candidatus Parcubacteria bacterium]|nr:triose-phosphate isomerase [Candidatus Parcubacteria bacterium]